MYHKYKLDKGYTSKLDMIHLISKLFTLIITQKKIISITLSNYQILYILNKYFFS